MCCVQPSDIVLVLCNSSVLVSSCSINQLQCSGEWVLR